MSNLIKRTVPVILAFVLLFTSLPSPVSADSDLFVNLLDYGVATEYGSNTSAFNGTSIPFTYDLPDRYTVTYVDVIFSYSNNAQISCYITDSSSSTSRGSLSVNNIGGPYFRAYGTITRRYYDNLILNFVSDTEVSGRRITVEKFNISTIDRTSNTVGGEMIGYSMGQYVNSSWGTESQSSSLSFPIGPSNDTIYNVSYRVDGAYWKKYDFLNFTLALDTLSIDSLSVSAFGGYVIPFEMSYLSDTENMNLKVINVSCDLRDLQRTYGLSDYVEVVVTGTTKANIEQHAHIYHAYGVTGFSAPSADLFWYQRLWNSIESGFSSLKSSISMEFNNLTHVVMESFTNVGKKLRSIIDALTINTGDSVEFGEDLDEQQTEIDSMIDTMDSVQQPDIDSIDVNIGEYVSADDLSSLTSPLSALFTGDIFGVCLILSIMMGTVSFVFYGKR